MDESTVRLSPETKRIVDDAVAFGEFDSPDAVVEEAVRLWRERNEDRLIESMGGMDAVRRLYRQGIDSGVAGALDIEQIIARGRQRG